MPKFTIFIVCSDTDEIFDKCEYLLDKNFFEVINKIKFVTKKQDVINFNQLKYDKLIFFSCLDLEDKINQKNNLVDNIHILKALSKIKKIKNKEFVCMATRKEEYAWDLIRKISSDLENNLRSVCNDKIRRYTTQQEVIKKLESGQARSKLEIIKYNNELSIKKTFRDNASRYLENEIAARKELTHNCISPVICAGENFIVIPLYENILKWKSDSFRLYPLDKARQIMTFVKWINSKGYALIDWGPGDMIFDKNNDLKVTDFEYFVKTDQKCDDFEKSIDFIRYSSHNNFIKEHKKKCYEKSWYPILGVTYDELMNKPDPSLIIKRLFFFFFTRIPRIMIKRIRIFLKELSNIFLWKLKYNFDKYFIFYKSG